MKRLLAAVSFTVSAVPAFAADQSTAINYWLTQYDGADLVSGQYACAAPAIPHASISPAEQQRVLAAYKAWRTCYQGMVANFDDINHPVGKRIPKEVFAAMTVEQRTAALDRLELVYDRVMAQAGSDAGRVIARFQDWKAHTEPVRLAGTHPFEESMARIAHNFDNSRQIVAGARR